MEIKRSGMIAIVGRNPMRRAAWGPQVILSARAK